MTASRVHVDRARCTSIGMCESIAPDYFEVGEDGELTLHREEVSPEDRDTVLEAVRSCPAIALALRTADG